MRKMDTELEKNSQKQILSGSPDISHVFCLRIDMFALNMLHRTKLIY